MGNLSYPWMKVELCFTGLHDDDEEYEMRFVDKSGKSSRTMRLQPDKTMVLVEDDDAD